jgi:hypothetical protein
MIPELKFDDLKPASSVSTPSASDLTKRPAGHAASPVRVKSVFWLWLINLLTLTALAGGLYYLYQGQQMSSQEVQGVYRRVDAMEKSVTDLDTTMKASVDGLKGLENRIGAGDTANKDILDRVEGLEKRLVEVKAALDGVRRTAETAAEVASRPAPVPVAPAVAESSATADSSMVPAEASVALGTIPVEK